AKRFNQAMMDIGASLCTRQRPHCDKCPLASVCQAHAHGQQSLYPERKTADTKPTRHTHFLMIRDPRGHVGLEKRPQHGIWGGLWSFPEFDSLSALKTFCQEQITVNYRLTCWPQQQHIFSHFVLQMNPVWVTLDARSDTPFGNVLPREQRWFSEKQVFTVGLAAPIEQLIRKLFASHDHTV
ncbi:MAG: NUDIX domain-containing protein, partial [Gammaproteobacteria bacterium]